MSEQFLEEEMGKEGGFCPGKWVSVSDAQDPKGGTGLAEVYSSPPDRRAHIDLFGWFCVSH